jgi:hypothetical protein
MFIEGGLLFVFCAVCGSGAMETYYQGGNLRMNPYFRKDDWKQRHEQTQEQNVKGKVLILVAVLS